MTPQAHSLALVVTLLLLLLIKIEGNSIPKEVYKNVTTVSSPSPAPQVNEVNQRPTRCRNRPWICSQGEFPPRSLCCRNRCVDVTSDISNCGLCGIRCRFNWQCCNRLCINTNVNPLNCGRCGRACPIGRLCLFGLCAYAQPQPVIPLYPPEQNPPLPQPPLFPPKQTTPKSQPPLFPPNQNPPKSQPPKFPPKQSPSQPQPTLFPPEQNAPQPQPQHPESPSQPPEME